MKIIPIRSIQVTQSEPKLTGGFSIRNLKDLMEGKDMVQEMHRHDFFFILVIKKGSGDHEIDFAPYNVTDDCIFFMRPGQVHQLTLQAGSTGYLLQFNAEFYYPKDKVSRQLLYQKSGKCRIDQESTIKFMSLLDQVFEEQANRPEGYQEVIKSNLNIFFIELVRTWKSDKDLTPHTSHHNQERLEELHNLIETHIFDCKQVSQYADKMNLSIYQLNAITKEILGKTCSEFINDHIILESKRYLLATSNQIKEIAYQMGYEDISYFSRLFKKHTGYSPEDFRQSFG